MKRQLLASLLATALFSLSAHAAKITPVNLDAANQGLNDPTARAPEGNNPGKTVGEQRRIAYQFAADLWGTVLQSNVEIRVGASFQPLSCTATSGTLGSAGPNFVWQDPNFAVPNSWYHIALADAIAGTNLLAGDPNYVAPDDVEIASRFNAVLGGTNPDGTACLTGSGWYYGLDGNTPAGQISFLDVVMHEIGHGLGFSGFIGYSSGVFGERIGTPGTNDIYTHFAYDSGKNLRFDASGETESDRAAAMKTQGRASWDGFTVKTKAPQALGTAQLLSATGALNAGYPFFGTAGFGPPATSSNFAGEVALVNDGTADTADACQVLPVGSLTGKVAFINRGTCGFEAKALAVQNAGAIAAIIANVSTSGSPGDAPGMAEDPTITATIPTLSLNVNDGNAFRSALASGTVNVTFGAVAGRLAGADADGRPLLYAPSTVANGSTFSHFDVSHSPNALMEPAINQDLDANLRLDLTPSLFQDLGWTLNVGNGKTRNGTCDTGVPVLSKSGLPGVIAGANIQASDNMCRASSKGNNFVYRNCMKQAIADIGVDNTTQLRLCTIK